MQTCTEFFCSPKQCLPSPQLLSSQPPSMPGWARAAPAQHGLWETDIFGWSGGSHKAMWEDGRACCSNTYFQPVFLLPALPGHHGQEHSAAPILEPLWVLCLLPTAQGIPCSKLRLFLIHLLFIFQNFCSHPMFL